MKIRKSVIAVALALGASAAHAGVLFDADGSGGATGPIDIGQLDWSVTSAVARGGNTAIVNWIDSAGGCAAGSCTFDVLTHARLVATTSQTNVPNTPAGLNSSYEVTLVARFQEVVTGVAGTTATFATTGSGLLQVYFSPVNSDDLTGTGFNDGTLILQGTLAEAGRNGVFTVFNQGPLQFDRAPGNSPGAGTDNYGDGTCETAGATGTSQCSTDGTGSQQSIGVDALTQDFSFFLTQLDTFGITFTNISQSLPFTSVDPSDCFAAGPAAPGAVGGVNIGNCAPAHVDGPYAAQGADPTGGYVPTTGIVNGLLQSGPDFVFQTDFNSTLRPAAIPEPGSLALLGLGLGAVGFGALKRRRKAS